MKLLLTELNYDQEYGQTATYCHTPMNNRFQLFLWWLSAARYFGARTEKSPLNAFTNQSMASF